MAKLKVGEKAPEFALVDQRGTTVQLKDYRGQRLVIYFYPKANTPGCTIQSCELRDAGPDLARLDAAVIGISPDTPIAQDKFDQKYSLGFPLLADENHAVASAWGVWGKKSMYGKQYMGIIRSAFVLDENAKITAAYYKVSPKDTKPSVLTALADMGANARRPAKVARPRRTATS